MEQSAYSVALEKKRQVVLSLLDRATQLSVTEISIDWGSVLLLCQIADIAHSLGQTEYFERTIDLAKQVTRRLRRRSDRDEALHLLAITLAEKGMNERAIEVAKQIKNEDLQIGAELRIIESLVKKGQTDKAFEIAFTMRERHNFDGILVTLSNALAEIGAIQQAFVVLEQIRDPEDRATALIHIARQQVSRGKLEPAVQSLDQAKAEALKIDDEMWRDYQLEDIAELQAEVGQVQSALETVQMISDRDIQKRAIRSVNITQILQGALPPTSEILAQLDPYTRYRVLIDFAKHLSQKGQIDEAKQMLRRACLAVGSIADWEDRIYLLREVATCQAQLGAQGDAEQVIRTAIQQAKGGKEPGKVIESLCDIATNCYLHLSRFDLAESLLIDAYQSAGQIHQPIARAKSLAKIGAVWLKVEKYDLAHKVFQEALETALTLIPPDDEIQEPIYEPDKLSQSLIDIAKEIAKN